MDVAQLLTGAAVMAVGIAIGLVIGAARWRSSGERAATGAELAALLAPAGDALNRVERTLREVERQRVGAYAGLTEQVAALHRSADDLGGQARNLAGALRSTTVRGQWGEVQLRRIVELAGMVEHCDFDVQVGVTGGDGRMRPDLVVQLAGGRQVPVDAKVPCEAWLQAQQTPDPDRQRRLVLAHAQAVRAQVDALAAKAYWRLFAPAPEFVIMFVPGDAILEAALSVDPGLTEYAFARHVVLATPNTLIALLRTIAFTWRQERLNESVDEVRRLGRELHERLGSLAGHLTRMGLGLERAVEAYNAAIGSVESRVLVTARRFADLGVGGDGIGVVEPLVLTPRQPRAPEFGSRPLHREADHDETIRRIP